MPFRPTLEQEISTWSRFKKGLSPADQEIFKQLMHYARQHGDAGSLAGRPLISEVIFLSIAIEQYNSIHHLQDQLHSLHTKLVALESRSK